MSGQKSGWASRTPARDALDRSSGVDDRPFGDDAAARLRHGEAIGGGGVAPFPVHRGPDRVGLPAVGDRVLGRIPDRRGGRTRPWSASVPSTTRHPSCMRSVASICAVSTSRPGWGSRSRRVRPGRPSGCWSALAHGLATLGPPARSECRPWSCWRGRPRRLGQSRRGPNKFSLSALVSAGMRVSVYERREIPACDAPEVLREVLGSGLIAPETRMGTRSFGDWSTGNTA